ncbi:MAG TPA: MazG nucleotide pyrophosphohydrolase domain-containing protein [Acidimicrobiales bacterium]
MEIAAFQSVIADTFADRDRRRGLPASVAWLCEEVGELAKAARKGSPAEQLEELADVLAWTASIAGQLGLSLDHAVQRYANGYPKCDAIPCACPFARV